jgi:hypothetical protein
MPIVPHATWEAMCARLAAGAGAPLDSVNASIQAFCCDQQHHVEIYMTSILNTLRL